MALIEKSNGRLHHPDPMTKGDSATATDDLLRREWQVLRERLDPIARDVLAADAPWRAYEAANAFSGALIDDVPWMPHGGRLYVAWADVTDLYEVGDVTLEVAHRILRSAASRWLDRPDAPTPQFLGDWLAATKDDLDTTV